jgi:hypothetical protein
MTLTSVKFMSGGVVAMVHQVWTFKSQIVIPV